MPIISQNLTVPAGLADGQTASASQILPLYSAMNAFNIPGTIGVFQQSFVDNALYTITVGGTATKDWSFSTTQTQNKAGFYLLPFEWNTGTTPAFTLRVNGAAVTAAGALTAAATGGGLLVVFMGAVHDVVVPRPLLAMSWDSGGTQRLYTSSASLPAADITSFGITATGGTTVVNFKGVRFWSEG